MKFISFIISLNLFFFISCDSGAKKTEKTNDSKLTGKVEFIRGMRIKSPLRNNIYTLGQEVQINIVEKSTSPRIDSIQIFDNNKKIICLKSKDWKYNWTPKGEKLGTHYLKLIAFHKNGKQSVINTHIKIKSNFIPKQYTAKVINTFPHERSSYTQGLFFLDGFIYESTGQYGESSIRKLSLKKAEILSDSQVNKNYFCEGITHYNGKMYQLTWRSGKAFVRDIDSFEELENFSVQTSNREGWGITNINNLLYISDGSNNLTIINTESLSKQGQIEVYSNKGAIKMLNELEYIDGKIWANVWLTDEIAIINPQTGAVEAFIDLSDILSKKDRSILTTGDDVLNGIAYDKDNHRIFVTGKRWTKLLEIELVE